MIVLRWLVFSLLAFLGGWVIICNWVIPFQQGGGSLIPVIGGAFAAVALEVIPVGTLHRLWWAPPILDLGCLPLLLLTAWSFIWHAMAGRGK